MADKRITATPAGGRQKPMDANQDGTLDIADPVAIPCHMFPGTMPALPCGDGTPEEASSMAFLDANGEGVIDVSCPGSALGYLFLDPPRPEMCTGDPCSFLVIQGDPDKAECSRSPQPGTDEGRFATNNELSLLSCGMLVALQMPFHRRKRSVLSKVDVCPSTAPLPPAVTALLCDAGARIDAFFDRWRNASSLGFFPADYESVYAVLKSIRESNPEATRLCEWGSGFGVIAGLATILGYDACGIEIDGRCVSASRSLLKDHGLDAEILEGSFIPEEYAEQQEMSTDGTGTVLGGAGAVDEVDVEIEDFDLIFAFPWPDEQEMYSELFARYAAVGAILVTYSAIDGIAVQRKMKG